MQGLSGFKICNNGFENGGTGFRTCPGSKLLKNWLLVVRSRVADQ